MISEFTLEGLSKQELPNLCDALRTCIIDTVSQKGGHLSSNLGSVELTVALHYLYASPKDKFIWDTSHQTYAHKLLTGRGDRFSTIRQYNGLSGFSDPSESPHDHNYAGHAGTALSIALGMAKNRDIHKEDHSIVSVIGDAAFTCGLTLEALNNIPQDLQKFVIILNDNGMSISPNVGSIKTILSRLVNHPRSNKLYQTLEEIIGKIPRYGNTLAQQGTRIKQSMKHLVSSATYFENFYLEYIGPIDGHNVELIVDHLEAIKDREGPVILHLKTMKGKGLPYAVNTAKYHGVKKFNVDTGAFYNTSSSLTFPKVFGNEMLHLTTTHKDLISITPAMSAGSCLDKVKEHFPDRCLDVGIAEGHALTYAGGAALSKKSKVFVSIYATFLQRALDNLFQDICLQNAPVTIAIDRGGLSPGDGKTHHGIYDISFLQAMPNLSIAQPRTGSVLRDLLRSSMEYTSPTAIRYPNQPTHNDDPYRFRPVGKAESLHQGEKICFIGVGHMAIKALELCQLFQKENINPTVIDPIFLKPLDTELLSQILASHTHIITIEEASINSGFGLQFNQFVVSQCNKKPKILQCGLGDHYIEHGDYANLLKENKLDLPSLYERIRIFIET